MVGLDSDFRYHPENGEVKPWIPVQDMVREGSLGSTLVSQIPDLGVRLRPETIFNQPLSFLRWKGKRVLSELQSHNLGTTGDILRLNDDELAQFSQAPTIVTYLREYLTGLEIPPHGWLVGIEYPTPPDREAELIDSVKGLLLNHPRVSQEAREILPLRFGLEDGIRRPHGETGRILSPTLSALEVSRIEQDNIFWIEHRYDPSPLSDKGLKECYFVLPPQSIGRKAFGAVFMKDLPAPLLTGSFLIDPGHDYGDVSFSEEARREMTRETDGYPYTLSTWPFKFAAMDFTKEPFNFSEQTQGEIERVLRKIVDDPSAFPSPFEQIEKIVGEWEERSKRDIAQQREAGNLLLPELLLLSEEFPGTGTMVIESLDLPKETVHTLLRAEIRTIGDFLAIERESLLEVIPGLTRKDVVALARVIVQKFQLPLRNKEVENMSDEDRGARRLYPLDSFDGRIWVGEQMPYIVEKLAAVFPPIPPEPPKTRRAADLTRLHQTMDRKTAEHNKRQIAAMRELVNQASTMALRSAEEIQWWLLANNRNKQVLGVSPGSWIMKAMIEYVLSHPEEEQER